MWVWELQFEVWDVWTHSRLEQHRHPSLELEREVVELWVVLFILRERA